MHATHPYRAELIARAANIRSRCIDSESRPIEPGVWFRHVCADESVRPFRVHSAIVSGWSLYLYPIGGDCFALTRSYEEVPPPADAGSFAEEVARAADAEEARLAMLRDEGGVS